jgi:hypothetical protein
MELGADVRAEFFLRRRDAQRDLARWFATVGALAGKSRTEGR